MSELITLDDMAEFTGINYSSMSKLIARSTLKPVKRGYRSKLLFDKQAFLLWYQSGEIREKGIDRQLVAQFLRSPNRRGVYENA